MKRASRFGALCAVGLGLLGAASGCLEPQEVTFPEERQNPTGTLEASVATTGANPDPDGYELTIDESRSQSVTSNGTVTFTSLQAGSYQVTIFGVAPNCSVAGSTTQSFTIVSGATTSVAFSVSCP